VVALRPLVSRPVRVLVAPSISQNGRDEAVFVDLLRGSLFWLPTVCRKLARKNRKWLTADGGPLRSSQRPPRPSRRPRLRMRSAGSRPWAAPQTMPKGLDFRCYAADHVRLGNRQGVGQVEGPSRNLLVRATFRPSVAVW
jgi:hypothetical protein